MIHFTKNSKELIQFGASILVLIAGIVLIFISLFLDPVGVIHPTVITVFGMFLSFIGAVWNIDLKYEYKTRELESTVRHRLNEDNEKEVAD